MAAAKHRNAQIHGDVGRGAHPNENKWHSNPTRRASGASVAVRDAMRDQGIGGVFAASRQNAIDKNGVRRRGSGSSFGQGTVLSAGTSRISDDDRSSVAGSEFDSASVAGSSASRRRRRRRRDAKEAIPDPFKRWSALWADHTLVVCFVVFSSVITAIEFRAKQLGL